ncbi:MAG TPA: sialidase family protein [Candidatus Acidoferrales bacterium]|nr:sialidase family protein [Candidatus Acidoferrales bacterium]
MHWVAPQKIRRVVVWVAMAIALPAAFAHAQTFLTAPVNLSGTGKAVVPSIAIGPAGDINVVWLDSGAILFRRSTDGGQSFSANMVVTTTLLPSQASQPQIAVNSAGVYVAWAGPSDVYFSSLATGSSTWSAPVNVSLGKGITPGSAAPVPHMAVDPSGGVDLVWGQSGAHFARFSGGTFSPAVQLTASAMASQSPRIAINAAGHVFIVWENAGSCPTITLARSTDKGGTFTPYSVADNLTVAGQPVTGCTSDVQIATGANNTIWLLWANENQNIQDVILTYSVDTDPFTPPGSASSYFNNLSSTSSYTPRMAIDASGDISVVWIGDYQQNGGPHAIYFTRSTNPQDPASFCGGKDSSCKTPPILTNPPVAGLATGFPLIAVEPSGAIDITWQQASAANPSAAYDIILARSTDGINFTKATLDSTPTTQSGTAQIAADGTGNVYATWDGNSGSSADILLNGDSAALQASAQFNINGVKLSASPLSATINAGESANFSLSLNSANSVPGSVTLACGGLPSGVSCNFNPNPVSLAANGSASTTLAVAVAVKPAIGSVVNSPGVALPAGGVFLLRMSRWLPAFAFILLAAVVAFGLPAGLPRFARTLALAALLAAAATGMSSCGGSTQSNGGGGGGPITFPLTLQGHANSGTATFQSISITVP